MHKNFLIKSKKYYQLYFISLGLITYIIFPVEGVMIAETITTFFTNSLKLVSLPIIFLSIVTTFARMNSLLVAKNLFRRIFFYTLLTTLIASSVALIIFLVIDPSQISTKGLISSLPEKYHSISYKKYLLDLIPSNIIQPFYENNVIGVLILAFLIGSSILFLPEDNRNFLNSLFSSLYATIMHIVNIVIKNLPFISVAFLILIFKDLKSNSNFHSINLYLLALLIANFLQACVILPFLLLRKKISPFNTFKAMKPALITAFFSKSSAAAMPIAIECSEKNLGITANVSRISFPLCTTINMNACAAFILITVLFVSQVEGVKYTSLELGGWILISTLAAIGNAGVPMGCYFLAFSLLSSMNIPLTLLGIILPFYAILDMLESAINLWSDACVTLIVDREIRANKNIIVNHTHKQSLRSFSEAK